MFALGVCAICHESPIARTRLAAAAVAAYLLCSSCKLFNFYFIFFSVWPKSAHTTNAAWMHPKSEEDEQNPKKSRKEKRTKLIYCAYTYTMHTHLCGGGGSYDHPHEKEERENGIYRLILALCLPFATFFSSLSTFRHLFSSSISWSLRIGSHIFNFYLQIQTRSSRCQLFLRQWYLCVRARARAPQRTLRIHVFYFDRVSFESCLGVATNLFGRKQKAAG